MNEQRNYALVSFKNRKAIKGESRFVNSFLAFINDLKAHLKITSESFNDYLNMSKDNQADIKDVGGYILGTLKDNERKADNIISRSMVTLDVDEKATLKMIESIYDFAELIDLSIFIHTTHKATSDVPRFRIIIPLSRDVTPFEYEFIAREIASELTDINNFDQTTFQANRLMYYPSHSFDGFYLERGVIGEDYDVDSLLKRHLNYKDPKTWKRLNGENAYEEKNQGTGKITRGDNKKGIIGAFCRAFSIEEAINTILYDVYTKGTTPNRYTYIPGSSSNGLRIYKDTDTAKCEDATDPANVGTSLNAFDLVRIHKFGSLDKDAKKDTPINRLPSYLKMVDFIKETYPEIYKEFEEEKEEAIKEGLIDSLRGNELFTANAQKTDLDWTKELTTIKVGKEYKVEATAHNLDLIFENDLNLKGLFGINELSYYPIFKRNILFPNKWQAVEGSLYGDSDDAFLKGYIENVYGINKKNAVQEALSRALVNNKFNPIKDYIESVTRDGKKRIGSLFIDYLGAEDSLYTRFVETRMLVAAIARIYSPGIKFDMMCVLIGDQGCGKSTLLYRLASAGNKDGSWYQDSISMEDLKVAKEAINGKWIVEIAELAGFDFTSQNRIKSFISATHDSFRRAYDRWVTTTARMCVFFGTTNQNAFLKDETGNRRFWPISCHTKSTNKSIVNELTDYEIGQIWAEAKVLYEREYKDKDINAIPEEIIPYVLSQRERYSTERPYQNDIENFIALKLPEKYYKLDIEGRRQILKYLKSGEESDYKQVEALTGENRVTWKTKDFICTNEIWQEYLGNNSSISNYVSEIRKMNDALVSLGYVKSDARKYLKIYGKQWVYMVNK